MSQWQTVRLGDVCQKIGSGATPLGGSGVYLSKGIALIRSQNVYNDGFHRDGLAFIGDKHASELSNVEVKANDVLLNITGDSVARVCQVPEDVLPARVNQHVAIIRPSGDKLDARYLCYYLTSPSMQESMLGLAAAGATRNALTKGMIEAFRIPAPPLPEQRAIASILGALDDKIELNRWMNETLEALAQSIFKSWFVDATQDGLPNDWRIDRLDKIAHFLNGLALQKFPPDGENSLPVIKIAQLRAGNTNGADWAGSNVPSEYVIDDGDVLFSWSGSLEVELWCGGRGALNQHLFKVTSATFPKWFYFLWTRYHLPAFRAVAAGKATTMGHIQRGHLSEAEVFIPTDVELEKMNSRMSPIIEKIIANNLESRTLAALRDALLPKLLSGELRLNSDSAKN